MSIEKHNEEHAMLGIRGFGPNAKTVGKRGDYSTLALAISSLGDRITQRGSATGVTTTLTNGDATVTFVGTAYKSLPSNTKPRIDDLITFRDDDRYYKIKYIVSDVIIELYEAYEGVNAVAVSMDHSWHYLDWKTLLITPGQHLLDGVTIPSGYVLMGFGAFSNTLSEIQITPGSPFNTIGETVFKDLTFAPTTTWGSLDAIARQNINPDGTETFWADQKVLFDSCTFDIRSLDGSHTGGRAGIPVMPRGTVYYNSCHIKNDNSATFENLYVDSGGSPVIATDKAHTRVICNNTLFEFAPGYDYAGFTFNNNILITVEATYEFNNSNIESIIDVPYTHVTPLIAGGLCIDSAVTDGKLTFNNTIIRTSIPSASQPSHGILIDGVCDIDINNANIEVDDDGIKCTNAGSTINVRGGRVSGGVNALHTTAGAINYDNNVTLIGGTTGAGVTNTPT